MSDDVDNIIKNLSWMSDEQKNRRLQLILALHPELLERSSVDEINFHQISENCIQKLNGSAELSRLLTTLMKLESLQVEHENLQKLSSVINVKEQAINLLQQIHAKLDAIANTVA